MNLTRDNLNAFWAKTPPTAAKSLDSDAYKPIPHHLLDVAAVALELQTANPTRLAREGRLWRCEPNTLAQTRAFLAALHDLGKFSQCFQSKAPEFWPTALLGPLGAYQDISHWVLTGRMLASPGLLEKLEDLFPRLLPGVAETIGFAVAGHHGRPPVAADGQQDPLSSRELSGREASVGKTCFAAAVAMFDELTRIVPPIALPELSTLAETQRFSWSLAGLTTLADWVGSDEAFFFKSDPPNTSIDAYWPLAKNRAQEAVAAKGLRGAFPAKPSGLSQVFPVIAKTPRPMQRAADDAVIPDGPILAILEDATGSGKTEAALVLASRMLDAGKGEGVYFALPTMATANAMFERLADAHRRLFADGATPSLALAHGKSQLSERFQEVRSASTKQSPAADPESAAAQCVAWIADDRRRAFFAEIGAGTIDQALLSVLPKKFLTLRQYGLAGRVLIVDEVHAFDIYTSKAVERLLTFHAAAGGSAILLSATLPKATRERLVAAFKKGQGANSEPSTTDAYPLLTLSSLKGVEATPVTAAEPTIRSVAIARLDTEAAARQAALAATEKGAAVLWVRNAVDDARAAAKALRAEGATVDLFHARFAMTDRLRHEAEALRRFGKEGRPEDRRGRILVATQVAEASLDLDFDALITDLAPIDAIIQRAGRLWRHMDLRPKELRPVAGPKLWLLASDPDQVADETWLHATQQKGGYVYPHAGVLWRTAQALTDARAIVAPDGLRALMERVYAERDLPEALAKKQSEAEGEISAGATIAGMNLVDLAAGYPGMPKVHLDQEIGTRLGRPTRTLRLARRQGDRLAPWATEEPDLRRAWALSEVICDETWTRDLEAPPELAPLIDAVRADWPDWDRTIIAVVEDEVVQLIEPDGDAAPLTYHEETGLRRSSSSTRG